MNVLDAIGHAVLALGEEAKAYDKLAGPHRQPSVAKAANDCKEAKATILQNWRALSVAPELLASLRANVCTLNALLEAGKLAGSPTCLRELAEARALLAKVAP